MRSDGRRYSIGDMSRLCNVSKKALRLYDEMGLISSVRDDGNNYRLYTHDELLMVPVLKYYKQMGFRLDEMKGFITGGRAGIFGELKATFERKADELRSAQAELVRCEKCVRDWYGLIKEAELVIAENVREISVKYVQPRELLSMEAAFDGDVRSAVISIDFMSYVERTSNAITGPVFIRYESLDDRMARRPQSVRILQETLSSGGPGEREVLGGCMMATCYHIGPMDGIPETYSVLSDWIRRHGYTREEWCCERYVADYWTTNDESCHVAELMVRVTRD